VFKRDVKLMEACRMKDELKRSVLEKVDKALSILGEDAKHIIYSRLLRVYGVKREDIPFKLNDFRKTLEDLIGLGGADVIEKYVAEKLYEELNIEFEKKENWTLAEYVERLIREVNNKLSMESPVT